MYKVTWSSFVSHQRWTGTSSVPDSPRGPSQNTLRRACFCSCICLQPNVVAQHMWGCLPSPGSLAQMLKAVCTCGLLYNPLNKATPPSAHQNSHTKAIGCQCTITWVATWVHVCILEECKLPSMPALKDCLCTVQTPALRVVVQFELAWIQRAQQKSMPERYTMF